MKSIDSFDVRSKKILLRVDLNIPSSLTDLTRIEHVKSTLNILKDVKKIYIVSHFGRPKGYDPELSLRHLIPLCEQVWERKVSWHENKEQTQICMLENIRFDLREEKNDKNLAKELASLTDLYVNEAFSCSHRAHASIEAITHELPSFAGVKLFEEVSFLSKLQNLARPSVALIGGAKISTKINVLKNLSKKFDILIIGGAMAHPFLVAKGYDIGKSLCEFEYVPLAKDLLNELGDRLVLPVDGVTSNGQVSLKDLGSYQSIYDVGDQTMNYIENIVSQAQTILWNGPLGYFEKYLESTRVLCRVLSERTQKGATVIAGGGETVAAIHAVRFPVSFSHISTAGGAFIEWIEGRTLPGIAALNLHT